MEIIVFFASVQTGLGRFKCGYLYVRHTTIAENLPRYEFSFDSNVYEVMDSFKEWKINVQLAGIKCTAGPRSFTIEGLVLVLCSDKVSWKRIGYWYASHRKEASTPSLPPEDFQSLRAMSKKRKQITVLI